MSNKWIIVIGFTIIILGMVMSFNQVKENEAYIKGNPQIAANAQADKEKLDQYLKDYMPDANVLVDGSQMEDTQSDEPEAIKHGIGAVINDEDNTVRLNYDDFYIVYTHDGTEVIGAKAYFDFNTNEDAKKASTTIDVNELGENVKSVDVVDTRVVIEFEDEVYRGMSTDMLKSTAMSFQLIGSNK